MITPLYPAVILSGGLATRLRPVTTNIPKSLVEINNEPFISHQLKLLHAKGIRHAILCVGFLGEMIADYVGDGSRFNMKIDYARDGSSLLGTAGAIKNALPLLPNHFFVIYGDSYLTCDYLSIQNAYVNGGKQGLMTVFRNENQFDKSNVEFKNNHIVAYDKTHQTSRMNYIDYGLGVFNQQAFDFIPENTTYDLAAVYQKLLKENNLTGYEVSQRFYETGSFTGIKELEHYLEELTPEY